MNVLNVFFITACNDKHIFGGRGVLEYFQWNRLSATNFLCFSIHYLAKDDSDSDSLLFSTSLAQSSPACSLKTTVRVKTKRKDAGILTRRRFKHDIFYRQFLADGRSFFNHKLRVKGGSQSYRVVFHQFRANNTHFPFWQLLCERDGFHSRIEARIAICQRVNSVIWIDLFAT